MPSSQELEDLFRSMRRIARAIDIQSRKIDREFGLTLPQLVVLNCVHRMGEVTSRAISREAELSPATVVGILDNLELKGLVARYRSGIDRRIVHTKLTEKGMGLAVRAPFPLGDAFSHGFSAMPSKNREIAVGVFRQIADLADPPLPPEMPRQG